MAHGGPHQRVDGDMRSDTALGVATHVNIVPERGSSRTARRQERHTPAAPPIRSSTGLSRWSTYEIRSRGRSAQSLFACGCKERNALLEGETLGLLVLATSCRRRRGEHALLTSGTGLFGSCLAGSSLAQAAISAPGDPNRTPLELCLAQAALPGHEPNIVW